MSATNAPAVEMHRMLPISCSNNRAGMLEQLLTPVSEGGLADLAIRVKGKVIPACRALLMAASPVFNALLAKARPAATGDAVVTVDLPSELVCDAFVLSEFVRYCVLGSCDISSGYAWELLKLGHACGVYTLVQDCSRAMVAAGGLDTSDIWKLAERANGIAATPIIKFCAQVLEKDTGVAARELVPRRMACASGATVAAVIALLSRCVPEMELFELIVQWHDVRLGGGKSGEMRGLPDLVAQGSGLAGKDGSALDSSAKGGAKRKPAAKRASDDAELRKAVEGLRLSLFSPEDIKNVLMPSRLFDAEDVLNALLFATRPAAFPTEERDDIRFLPRVPHLQRFGSLTSLETGSTTQTPTGVVHGLNLTGAAGCFLRHQEHSIVAAIASPPGHALQDVTMWYRAGRAGAMQTCKVNFPATLARSGITTHDGDIYVLHAGSSEASLFSPLALIQHGNAKVQKLPSCMHRFRDYCMPCTTKNFLWAVAMTAHNVSKVVRYKFGAAAWEDCGITFPNENVQLVLDPVDHNLIWAVSPSVGLVSIRCNDDSEVTVCKALWGITAGIVSTGIVAAFAIRSDGDATIIGAFDGAWLFIDTSNGKLVRPRAGWPVGTLHVYNYVDNSVWVGGSASTDFISVRAAVADAALTPPPTTAKH